MHDASTNGVSMAEIWRTYAGMKSSKRPCCKEKQAQDAFVELIKAEGLSVEQQRIILFSVAGLIHQSNFVRPV
jgi:hypothetical protein